LRAVGYEGFLSFECEVGGEDAAAQLREAFAHMSRLLD
jgi:hypothetical protein